ncbi:hypothetical protein [Raoultella planticola]|uniref:FidL-like membrane protein n=1 Tax=Raoultella planticola TaxID=575 RepID=A0ABU5MB21_RAOPL|nr:hypothetical protein [Raoultella planticola]MDW4557111.1 hypothetical protein [Raoultella planticola]MDZ7448785.1 hypothetical protein [Raoultella planticola]MDZ7469405.1 hypothetical protein [Raoultella planticola]MDZ7509961.1 hypothetical protein [Raoultella planticola]MEA5398165.1 hypothetical protein [Raoultella planticola]
MRISRKLKVLLPVLTAATAAVFIYSLWSKKGPDDFSCVASFSQHYANENIDVSLRFMFSGQAGVVSINGRARSDSQNIFNRKISFSMRRHQDIYYMTSEKNIKFPDDNVDDGWLSQYQPDFFVYPDKSLHIRINQQKNGNYLFMFSALPTYICNAAD